MTVKFFRGKLALGSFREPANWNPAGVPGDQDVAVFDENSPKYCRLNGDHAIGDLQMLIGFSGGTLEFSGIFEIAGSISEIRAGSLNPLTTASIFRLGGELTVSGASTFFTGGRIKGKVVVNGTLITEGQEGIFCGSDFDVGASPLGGRWENMCAIISLDNGALVQIGPRGALSFRDRKGQPTFRQMLGKPETPKQLVRCVGGNITVAPEITFQCGIPIVASEYSALHINSNDEVTGILIVNGRNATSDEHSILIDTGSAIEFTRTNAGNPTLNTAAYVLTTSDGMAIGTSSRARFDFLSFRTAGGISVQGSLANFWAAWDHTGDLVVLDGGRLVGAAYDGTAYSRCTVSNNLILHERSELKYGFEGPVPPLPQTVFGEVFHALGRIDGDFRDFSFGPGRWLPGPRRGPVFYDLTYTGP